MKKFIFKSSLLIVFALFFAKPVVAQNTSLSPDDHGTWYRNPRYNANGLRDEIPVYIKGIEIGLKWRELQPTRGQELDEGELAKLKTVIVDARDGLKIKLSIDVGPDAPDWIYEGEEGTKVPKVYALSGESEHAKWKYYPHYTDENYITAYFNLIEQFSKFLRELETDNFRKIAFVQVKTGCTGDEEPYKGKVVDIRDESSRDVRNIIDELTDVTSRSQLTDNYQYDIEDADWITFKQESYLKFKECFNDSETIKHGTNDIITYGADSEISLSFNGINSLEEGMPSVNNLSSKAQMKRWVMEFITYPYGIKGGYMNRGTHILNEVEFLEEWKSSLLISADLTRTFASSEIDAAAHASPVFLINPAIGFYWPMVASIHSGLSISAVSDGAMEKIIGNTQLENIFKTFNTYAGQVDPTTATNIMSVFHQGFDLEDKVTYSQTAYPISKGFTDIRREDVDRYDAVCGNAGPVGAQMDDLDILTESNTNQRRDQTGYNDAGWGIITGNYERFLTQIDADGTSEGLFRIGTNNGTTTVGAILDSESSPYDRFARRLGRKGNKMHFEFDDELFSESIATSLIFKIRWLDESNDSKWKLRYKNFDGKSVTKDLFVDGEIQQNDGSDDRWLVLGIEIFDLDPNRVLGGEGANFLLVNTDSKDDIFSGIEIEIVRDGIANKTSSKSSKLDTETEKLANVSIFNTNNETIKIIGLENGETSVKVFNIFGKQVMAASFNASNSSKELALPSLKSGVYFVKLNNQAGTINKGIVIK